jgi:predicted GNAT superfamily acetyltransferase
MTLPKLQVRPLKTLGEFQECERIQEEVWGGAGVTAEVISVAAKYGGAVLGAFSGGRMAGFLFAILARRRGRLVHWSHMMAVREGFRDRGLGFKMKIEHRRLALAAGIKSICWTFDPLQSRNAALNVARLGATIEEYLPECYGRFPSAIERGLASDRFVVNWKIAAPRVERRLREAAPSLGISAKPRANETSLNSAGLLVNRQIHLRLSAPSLLVEIPARTDAMRANDLKLAARWRRETRRIFQSYFRAGYRVADFVPPAAATGGKCFYVLRQTRNRG